MAPLPSTVAARTIALAQARKSIYLATASSAQSRAISSTGTQPHTASVSAMSSSIFLATSLAAKTAGASKSSDKLSYDAQPQYAGSLQNNYLRAVARKMAGKKEAAPSVEPSSEA